MCYCSVRSTTDPRCSYMFFVFYSTVGIKLLLHFSEIDNRNSQFVSNGCDDDVGSEGVLWNPFEGGETMVKLIACSVR